MRQTRGWAAVIPSDSVDSLAAAAGSVLARHPGLLPDEIVVVTGTIAPRTMPDILKKATLVRDEAPFLFARRANMGFAAAEGRDVVLMGDDVTVCTPGAFDSLSEASALRLVAPAVVGRVGPPWQRPGQGAHVVPFVSFICVYIPKGVRDIVGPIEEGFPGYGYEDTDYCLRAVRAGITCGVRGDVVVEHGLGAQSHFVRAFGPKLPDMEGAAREAFYAKHAAKPS